MFHSPKLLIPFALTALLLGVPSVGRAQNPVVGVSFRNDTKATVIVQCWMLVNNMPRRGQAIQVNPGKTVSDNSLPAGTRNVSVYDANQPTRVYLRDQAIDVPRNSDLVFSIRPHPNVAQRVVLKQD